MERKIVEEPIIAKQRASEYDNPKFRKKHKMDIANFKITLLVMVGYGVITALGRCSNYY
ncbi:MAG: hypothetical protein AABX84_02400 [Nanoarchaeota archaeon]